MGQLFSKKSTTPPPRSKPAVRTRAGRRNVNDFDNLDAITYTDTKPYIPPITKGKVIRVYDGDTITIATYIHNIKQPYRFSVRLANIDTPELRTTNPTEKQFATIIRDKLNLKIMNKTVLLSNVSTEKYGRLLATVTLENETKSINDWMLEKKYAVEYTGGAKTDFNPKDFSI